MRGSSIVTRLLESKKRRKKLFIRITNSTRFEVDLRWRVANASGNQTPRVSSIEKVDYEELRKHEFPWTLVLDKEEIDKFWPKVVLPNDDPSIAFPINPDF